MIRRVYVAGPYSHPARGVRIRNAWTAGALGALVAEAGAYPVVPHLVGMHVAEHCDVQQSYEWWIEATRNDLLTCHAMILAPGWKTSRGALGEVDLAKWMGLPVFESIDELSAWLGD